MSDFTQNFLPGYFLRELVDIHYSHCEKIVLVMDDLNIHSIASLYRAFEPAQARRIIQRLEIHRTPIHASWLNMAEIEIGILSRQCLSQSFYLRNSYLDGPLVKGFGLLGFFDQYKGTYFRSRVRRRPTSNLRGSREKQIA